MNIRKIFDNKKVIFSFEIFPPKTDSGVQTIYNTLEELKNLKPDFISVTYGAGGNLADNRTIELSSVVKNMYGIETLAHLTCIGSTKNEIDNILEELKREGIENILALRGDIPNNKSINSEFRHARDLINHIKYKGNFNVIGACYPEGHIDCRDLDKDAMHLKLKEEAGATHFISQLFFDNNYFYDFLDRKERFNIKAPIQAGIMPVTSDKQVERIVSLCGTKIPNKFLKILERYGHDREALRDAGIAYAVDQIVDLISSGVQGVHLYTMNNPYVAKKISSSVTSILDSVNRI